MILRLELEAKTISQALKLFLFLQYATNWTKLEKAFKDSEDCKCEQDHTDNCKFQRTKINIIKDFCKIPILGFNSGKYDMTFIIQHMINPLFPIGNIITKSKGYMKLGYKDYEFLDVHNYVPPNVNLNLFRKMWGVKDIEKGIFPYEWFDSKEKLNVPELPPIEAFHNRLKNEACEPFGNTCYIIVSRMLMCLSVA